MEEDNDNAQRPRVARIRSRPANHAQEDVEHLEAKTLQCIQSKGGELSACWRVARARTQRPSKHVTVSGEVPTFVLKSGAQDTVRVLPKVRPVPVTVYALPGIKS